MKSSSLINEDNGSIERRSDLIKSEIAKYRLLKSKGVLTSNEDFKDKTLSIKSTFSAVHSPSKNDENTAFALTQSTPVNNSLVKNDQRASSLKRNQNQGVSFQNISSGRLSSDRERLKIENYNNSHSLTPSAKDNGSESAKNKNTAYGKSINNTGKRHIVNKSGLPFSDKKEKTWSFIEEFVDTELERDLLSKGSKTTKNQMKAISPSETFSKSQISWTSKKSTPAEKRASSALDMNGKNSRENKSFTPNSLQNREEELGRKNSVPDSPSTNLTEEVQLQSRKRNFLTPTQDLKGLPQRENKNAGSPSVILANGRSPRQMSSPKRTTEENEKGLRDEVEKWRIFGKMMAESYDDLNKKYTEYMKEKEKDKKIVGALKEQVNTLKALLKASKEENVKIQESSKTMKDSAAEKRDTRELQEISALLKELETIKNQNQEAMKIMDFLKNENEALKKTIDEGQKYKQIVDHYQKLADVRFKECSALAEEIICLRTDLDRSHSNFLRIQREQSSGKKVTGDNFFSGKKPRQINDQDSSYQNSTAAQKKLSGVKVSTWNEETDDEPPMPADLKAIPSKEESAMI